MALYRKKPVVIEAVQWDGANMPEITAFCTEIMAARIDGEYKPAIKTLEGIMTADIGDFIIKGVNGEFYPCKPDIFEKTYEPVQ